PVNSPRFGAMNEVDPSVCYRHLDRQSWTLCQRCGRTICPECQILAPVGVQCPECVAEAGGSVQWTPTNTQQEKKKAAARRQPSRERSALSTQFAQMLRPGGDAPSLSWVFAGAVIVMWIAGLFTSNVPFVLLAAAPEFSMQIWRYATAPFAAYAAFDITSILMLAISMFFWLYFAPS